MTIDATEQKYIIMAKNDKLTLLVFTSKQLKTFQFGVSLKQILLWNLLFLKSTVC